MRLDFEESKLDSSTLDGEEEGEKKTQQKKAQSHACD